MPPQIPGAQDLQQSALSNFAHSSAVVRPQTETDLKNPSSQSVIAINIHKCLFPFFFFSDIRQEKLAEETLSIKQMFLQLTSALWRFYSLGCQEKTTRWS